MAKNIIAGNDLNSYKKKYKRALSKGKLTSFTKKEVNSLSGGDFRKTSNILSKNKKYELIGDTFYEKPNNKKKIIIIGASIAIAGAAGATTAHLLLANPTYGSPSVVSADGNLVISGATSIKKGQSYTGTIQVPTNQQSNKTLPFVIKEVKTGDKILGLKDAAANSNDDNYYSFDRHNDVAGQIYIHKVEGPISILVELNEKGRATRVEKVEIVSSVESIGLNSTVHLSAKVYPEYASNQGISWEVLSDDGKTNSSLASINRYGDLTAGAAYGTIQVVAVSNDTQVRSEPIIINVGEVEDNIGFNIYENYGSLNVRVSQNKFTSSKTELNLKVDGRNILSLDPIYSYARDKVKGAFEGLTSLVDVILPETIVEISENCFKDCTNLDTIVIPQNIRGIGKNAFAGCTSLKKVVILDTVDNPAQLQAIEEGAFSGCINLESIGCNDGISKEIGKMPATLDTIGAEAFLNCGKALEEGKKFEFELSETTSYLNSDNKTTEAKDINGTNLTGLGPKASDISTLSLVKYSEDYKSMYFDGGDPETGCTLEYLCEATKNDITIPSHMIENSHRVPGEYCLYRVVGIKYFSRYNSNISSVEFPYTLVSIEEDCFIGATKLTKIHIPSNVKYIYPCAFQYTSNLTEIKIDEGVEYICDSAFEDTPKLKPQMNDDVLDSITLPSSIKHIGAWCFYGRTNLEEIIFKGNTDTDGNKCNWYTVYDYTNSLVVATQDLDKDENGDFMYQHFNDDSGADDNVYMLTANNRESGGYAGFSFFKNAINEIKYSGGKGDDKYSMHDPLKSLSEGLYSFDYLKSGVQYCYLLDFTKEETKDINCLRLVNDNIRTVSPEAILKREGDEDSIIDEGDILINGIKVYDEHGNQILEGIPSIDMINTYGEIDLSYFTKNSDSAKKYDKIYLYLTYDIDNANITTKDRNKRLPTDIAGLIDATEINVRKTGDVTDAESEGGYNFINCINLAGERINTDEDTLHYYNDGFGDYVESSRVRVEAGNEVTYSFDCSELSEYEEGEAPYYYAYELCVQNSPTGYPTSKNVEVSAIYTDTKGNDTQLNAKWNKFGDYSSAIELTKMIDWKKDDIPMPQEGTITITVKYPTTIKETRKVYLYCRPGIFEGELENSLASIEVDSDDDSKNK